ncbi:MAG: hypothetical protein HY299_14955 [Verrucomicrobia bacterium]|nr:hypothetical protein [Verrucomicrobiota bacterium]
MFANGQLTRRRQHKAALLQRSGTHRSVLAKEAQNLRPVAEWADLGIAVARKTRSGWAALEPLLSLWQTRKQEPSGLVHKLATITSLARSLATLWKSWR